QAHRLHRPQQSVTAQAREPNTFSEPRLRRCSWWCLQLRPTLYAWWKTGNRVFPVVNSGFRSPYFTNTSLIDARFKAPFTWKTPYEETGRGGRDSPNVPGGIELGLRNPS